MSDFAIQPECRDEEHAVGLFEEALRAFEVSALNFATRFIKDAAVRRDYLRQAKALSTEYLSKINSRSVSPYQAATEVNTLRNEIMELARIRSTALGRARATQLKKTGKLFEELCQKYAKELFKKDFTRLNRTQQSQVYKEMVKAAGRTRPSVNVQVRTLSRVGKGLFVLSLAIAVFNVATAEDKVKAAGREGVAIGGGVLGGMAGGATAGLVCGPGAPVCVTIGIFVGGVLGGIGADFAFDSLF